MLRESAMRIPIIVLVVGLATGGVAHAQVSLPRNDTTVSIGWFGAKYDQFVYNRWHQSLFSGAGVGHYCTDHQKTEIEAAWLSRVSFDSYGESVAVDGGTAYLSTGYRYQDVRVSVAQAYQFGRNAWVHPYLAVGVDVNHLRQTEDRPAQRQSVFFSNGSRIERSFPAARESEASVRARPFVKAGFKMYVSERAFITTDWKIGVGDGVQHVLWRTGIGVDF